MRNMHYVTRWWLSSKNTSISIVNAVKLAKNLFASYVKYKNDSLYRNWEIKPLRAAKICFNRAIVGLSFWGYKRRYCQFIRSISANIWRSPSSFMGSKDTRSVCSQSEHILCVNNITRKYGASAIDHPEFEATISSSTRDL